MKPDPLEDLGSATEDRRDNRRALLVALVAVLVIAVACIALLASLGHAPANSSPNPNSMPSSSQLPFGHFGLE
jgi:hypothetical protein